MVDRVFGVALRHLWSGWVNALMKPETVVSWHRAGFSEMLSGSIRNPVYAGSPTTFRSCPKGREFGKTGSRAGSTAACPETPYPPSGPLPDG